MRICSIITVVSMIGFTAAAFFGCDSGNGPAGETKPLEIVAPKGGESYKVGQTVEIRWKINDASKIGSVGIVLSLDNGKTFLDYDLEPSKIRRSHSTGA